MILKGLPAFKALIHNFVYALVSQVVIFFFYLLAIPAIMRLEATILGGFYDVKYAPFRPT